MLNWSYSIALDHLEIEALKVYLAKLTIVGSSVTQQPNSPMRGDDSGSADISWLTSSHAMLRCRQ